jgi:PKD repeat protein
VVKNPERGDWTIHLFGAAVPAAGEQVNLGVTEIGLEAPVSYVAPTPDRGVAPLTVQFDSGGAFAAAGATITSYRWDFGDCSAVVSVPIPSHVFKAAGKYTVALTVTDSNGLADTAYDDVVVSAYNHPPIAEFLWGVIDPAKPLLVVMNETAQDIDGQITSYQWTLGDGTSGSGRLLYHTYAKGGTYPVTLTVTDDGGLTGAVCHLVTTGQAFQPSAPPVMC